MSPFRRRIPPFAIVSLPRSGSTALYRVLGVASRVSIACEPEFDDDWETPRGLDRRCRRLFRSHSGMKHVWDPNGWPFVNKWHQSTLENLAESERWIGVNASLLGCVQRVVRLTRKNQLARVISDLLGQQTHLWGHDPAKPHSERDAEDYRAQVSQRELRPIDERLIEWYLRNGQQWDDRIVALRSQQPIMSVCYEDLFGADVAVETRLDRVAEIGDWLDIPVPVDDQRVRAIVAPGSKTNSSELYARIPNYDDIVARFGPIEDL